MKSFPTPLTPSEEKYYIQRYTEGDLQAKHILIERNLRLVAHIVKKYQYLEEDPEDLISIGTIGLIKAVVTFNADKGNRLAAYASKCIDNAILSQMRLWWGTNPPKAEKHQSGVFWHKFPRTSTSFVPLRTVM